MHREKRTDSTRYSLHQHLHFWKEIPIERLSRHVYKERVSPSIQGREELAPYLGLDQVVTYTEKKASRHVYRGKFWFVMYTGRKRQAGR